ncbi:C2H2-type zinc finger-containing protein [Tieghemostelium lacteum]|uniref:C2H2-type zinc finger-containing protein n=1 Tax=Tieghemostelium lacteum TaxID=361077 RepID=A0A151ZGB2_TIELA|nr:C2H2-type zinc finger-containing protein [Tieghemostelium lacteum]|eukprot:KYQ93003.1 C2H2-type zinc finger-containing protein [Tieghemostelium lacteum]
MTCDNLKHLKNNEDLYCKDCNHLVCNQCLKTHKEHVIVEYEKMIEEGIEEQYRLKIDQMNKDFQCQVQIPYDNLVKSINDKFNNIRQMIDKREKSLINEVQSHYKDDCVLFENLKMNIEVTYSPINIELSPISKVKNDNQNYIPKSHYKMNQIKDISYYSNDNLKFLLNNLKLSTSTSSSYNSTSSRSIKSTFIAPIITSPDKSTFKNSIYKYPSSISDGSNSSQYTIDNIELEKSMRSISIVEDTSLDCINMPLYYIYRINSKRGIVECIDIRNQCKNVIWQSISSSNRSTQPPLSNNYLLQYNCVDGLLYLFHLKKFYIMDCRSSPPCWFERDLSETLTNPCLSIYDENNHIYIFSGGNRILRFNINTNSLETIYQFKVKISTISSLCIHNSQIFIFTSQKIYKFNCRNCDLDIAFEVTTKKDFEISSGCWDYTKDFIYFISNGGDFYSISLEDFNSIQNKIPKKLHSIWYPKWYKFSKMFFDPTGYIFVILNDYHSICKYEIQFNIWSQIHNIFTDFISKFDFLSLSSK